MVHWVANTFLSIPALYRLFAIAVGADRVRRVFVDHFVKPSMGDSVLDIGCGPADVLDYLPVAVQYMGFDPSTEYINAARMRYGARATFEVGTVHDMGSRHLPGVELVLAAGILHHLNDVEARELFSLAKRVLKPGGRLVTFDGCYEAGQSWLAKKMLQADRGAYVRSREQYLTLASGCFQRVHATVRSDLLRLPYTHIILEAVK